MFVSYLTVIFNSETFEITAIKMINFVFDDCGTLFKTTCGPGRIGSSFPPRFKTHRCRWYRFWLGWVQVKASHAKLSLLINFPENICISHGSLSPCVVSPSFHKLVHNPFWYRWLMFKCLAQFFCDFLDSNVPHLEVVHHLNYELCLLWVNILSFAVTLEVNQA